MGCNRTHASKHDPTWKLLLGQLVGALAMIGLGAALLWVMVRMGG